MSTYIGDMVDIRSSDGVKITSCWVHIDWKWRKIESFLFHTIQARHLARRSCGNFSRRILFRQHYKCSGHRGLRIMFIHFDEREAPMPRHIRLGRPDGGRTVLMRAIYTTPTRNELPKEASYARLGPSLRPTQIRLRTPSWTPAQTSSCTTSASDAIIQEPLQMQSERARTNIRHDPIVDLSHLPLELSQFL